MLRPSTSSLVCAVALHEHRAILGLMSLEGYILEQHSVALPRDQSLAVQLVAEELQRMLHHRPARVMCAGVCTPAPAYSTRSSAKPHESFQTTAKIAERLRSILKIPVGIGSALHGTMLHEMTVRKTDTIRSAVLLHVSHDILGAIWANGEFLSEETGSLGHLCIDPRGPSCHCGNYGCWSLYASDSAALAAFQAASGQSEITGIAELHQMFADRHPAAIKAVKVQEEGIVAGIRTLTGILHPDLFIVQGSCAGIWQHLSARMEREIDSILGARKRVHLLSTPSGEFDCLKAAAALGWQAIDATEDYPMASIADNRSIHTA